MTYFLDTNDIDKINESDLKNIKLVAQHSIDEECGFDIFRNPIITIKNHAITWREKYPHLEVEQRTFKIIEETIELPATNSQGGAKKLPKTCKIRIRLETIGNKETFLYIRNATNDSNIKFVNGEEFIKFRHEFNQILEVTFQENYLAILTGNLVQRGANYKVEKRPLVFILIEFIERNKEDILMELFKTDLRESVPDFDKQEMIFNTKLTSKVLFITEDDQKKTCITFDVNTLKFSQNRISLPKSCWEIYYTFNNILQDLIIVYDRDRLNVYVIRQSFHGRLFVYNKITLSTLSNDEILDVFCCNNRDNEIILFFKLGGLKEYIVSFDVLNLKLHKSVFRINKGNVCDANSDVTMFFNPTGEEIFVVEVTEVFPYDVNCKILLSLFVYKSKVKSLKEICQMSVNLQYTREQLKLMNLPKFIHKILGPERGSNGKRIMSL